MKAFTDEKVALADIIMFIFNKIGNIVKKGVNAGYQHFLLFPQCFPIGIYSGSKKSWDFVVKGYYFD